VIHSSFIISGVSAFSTLPSIAAGLGIKPSLTSSSNYVAERRCQSDRSATYSRVARQRWERAAKVGVPGLLLLSKTKMTTD
jgi:hypothetical protein